MVGAGPKSVGDRFLERKQGLRGRNVAAERMIDDQEVIFAGDLGDRLMLEVAERPNRPVDGDIRKGALERFGQWSERADSAAMSPAKSFQP